eukprot:gene20096-17680_t
MRVLVDEAAAWGRIEEEEGHWRPRASAPAASSPIMVMVVMMVMVREQEDHSRIGDPRIPRIDDEVCESGKADCTGEQPAGLDEKDALRATG